MADALARARSGALFGLGMAGFYVAFVIVLFLVRGSAPFDRHGITLGTAVVSYVAGGLVGGAIVGLLHPLTARRAGATLVAVLAATVVFIFIGTAVDGPPWRWGRDEWEAAGVLGLLFGVMLGNFYYRAPPKPSRGADPSPRFRTALPGRPDEPEA